MNVLYVCVGLACAFAFGVIQPYQLWEPKFWVLLSVFVIYGWVKRAQGYLQAMGENSEN